MTKTVFLPSALLLLCAGCSSPVTNYEDENRPITIENKFSINDVSKFADTVVQQLLSRASFEGNEKPMVFLATIQNDTSEHIDTQAIADVIQRKLLESDRFRFTAGASGQKHIQEQIDWQASAALPETAVKAGRQYGAKYLMYGRLTDFTQKSDNKMSRDYMFTMRVANIETGEILAVPQDVIRKVTTK